MAMVNVLLDLMGIYIIYGIYSWDYHIILVLYHLYIM